MQHMRPSSIDERRLNPRASGAVRPSSPRVSSVSRRESSRVAGSDLPEPRREKELLPARHAFIPTIHPMSEMCAAIYGLLSAPVSPPFTPRLSATPLLFSSCNGPHARWHLKWRGWPPHYPLLYSSYPARCTYRLNAMVH